MNERPELERAVGMLCRAGVEPLTAEDAELLAADILDRATRRAITTWGEPTYYIDDAVHDIESRMQDERTPLEIYVRALRTRSRRVRFPA